MRATVVIIVIIVLAALLAGTCYEAASKKAGHPVAVCIATKQPSTFIEHVVVHYGCGIEGYPPDTSEVWSGFLFGRAFCFLLLQVVCIAIGVNDVWANAMRTNNMRLTMESTTALLLIVLLNGGQSILKSMANHALSHEWTDRPFGGGGGMPSCHTTIATLCYWSIYREYPEQTRLLAVTYAIILATTWWGGFHSISQMVAGLGVEAVVGMAMQEFFAN
jgi:membrane-associated phospholipid phosphatase